MTEAARRARKKYEASPRGKAIRAAYRKSGLGRLARAKARRSAKGKEGQRRRSRRWRDHHPQKAAAKLAALAFHGARRQAAAGAMHEGNPTKPVRFTESVDLLKRNLWREAAASAAAGDSDAADALYYEAHLIRPARRQETGSPIVGGGPDSEPANSADVDTAFDLLDDFGPHA